MRYLVISDTHGHKNYLSRIIRKEEEIRNIIFLGDGLDDVLSFGQQNPDYEIIAVTGNCDSSKEVPAKEIISIKGYKILICHGDGYYVKMAVAWLISYLFVKFKSETYTLLGKRVLDKFTQNICCTFTIIPNALV